MLSAREGCRALQHLKAEERADIINNIANGLIEHQNEIIAANQKDLLVARNSGERPLSSILRWATTELYTQVSDHWALYSGERPLSSILRWATTELYTQVSDHWALYSGERPLSSLRSPVSDHWAQYSTLWPLISTLHHPYLLVRDSLSVDTLKCESDFFNSYFYLLFTVAFM